jgi:hypothetical protein
LSGNRKCLEFWGLCRPAGLAAFWCSQLPAIQLPFNCRSKSLQVAWRSPVFIMHHPLEQVLTTLNTLHTNIDDLLSVRWHAVFVDEAHKLKNDALSTYAASMRLRTCFRYALVFIFSLYDG